MAQVRIDALEGVYSDPLDGAPKVTFVPTVDVRLFSGENCRAWTWNDVYYWTDLIDMEHND